MWPFNKKTPIIEEKKPTVVDIIEKLIIINNRTDKEYSISSNNDYGIFLKVFDDNSFAIRQRTLSADNDETWILVGYFNDFSVVSIEWNKVTIN